MIGSVLLVEMLPDKISKSLLVHCSVLAYIQNLKCKKPKDYLNIEMIFCKLHLEITFDIMPFY